MAMLSDLFSMFFHFKCYKNVFKISHDFIFVTYLQGSSINTQIKNRLSKDAERALLQKMLNWLTAEAPAAEQAGVQAHGASFLNNSHSGDVVAERWVESVGSRLESWAGQVGSVFEWIWPSVPSRQTESYKLGGNREEDMFFIS